MPERPLDVRRHLLDDVLAWWAEHGPDAEHGGVRTCWSNAGDVLLADSKYTWSQGRWAWLCAAVARAASAGVLHGVDAARWAEWSDRTAAFIRDHALLPAGGSGFVTAFVTTGDGRPFEPTPGGGLHTSIFADLFAALGFAGRAQLPGGSEWGALAESILTRSAAAILTGPVRSDPYPVPAGFGSFGLPMILVNVGEQVHRASGSAASAAIVRQAADLIETDHRHGDDVVEMPSHDASAADTLLARHRTPGHVLEALWFLHHAADLLAGHPLADPHALAAIAKRQLALGWDDRDGGLLRFTDASGGEPTGRRIGDPYEQLVVSTWDTKLWWPHAEALYTTALLAGATGDSELADWHDRLAAYTFSTFPDGPGREWTQIRSRDGSPLEATVALPVKDPFHIARALLLLVGLGDAA